ncbi:2TM domain-containing protein [Spongiimicrobium salis]|uniref:2TM domain-containing protein n=1 Tax=Spongiimicrobium salis TaxID=1667022 RepID=UPI00374DF952
MELMTTIEEEKRERAKNRVEELKGFYIHALVFVLVNPFLAFLNYMTTGWEPLWFIYPLLGWSLGLLIHGLCIFGVNPFLGKDWEQRKLREFMEEEDERGKWN